MAKRAAARGGGGGGAGNGSSTATTATAAATVAAARGRGGARAQQQQPKAPSSSFQQRLRENLAVGTYIYFIPVAFALNLLMVLLHRYTRWIWLAWVLAINFAGPVARASKTGRWPKPFRFWLSLWRPLASYFPAKLHKTADLDPQQRYLFVAAPHGLVTMFVWVAFDTDATDFSLLFPGIDVIPLTLEVNFKLPLLREFLLLHGIGDASMAACLTLLGRGPGSGILLAAGGAEESLLAEPGTMGLVLAKRKGFVKVALRTGARLVPVIGFGENELYGGKGERQGEEEAAEAAARAAAAAGGKKGGNGQVRRWFSRFLKRAFGFVLPEIRGVGPLGLMPRRSPLDVVIGEAVVFDERRALVAAKARRVREAERRAVAAAVEEKGEEVRRRSEAGEEKGKEKGEEKGKAGKKKGGGEGAGAGGKAAEASKAPSQPPEQEKDDEYSFDDMVEGYHAQYVEALKALYDAHKDRFLPGRKRDLEIVK